MAAQDARPVYTSGDWEIDLERRQLRLKGHPVDLGSRAFEVVEVLVQSTGELVGKYALMDRLWPGAVVEENTLQAHISAVRKALGADRGLLKTVSGRGYQLLGDWTLRQRGVAAAVPTAEPGRSFVTNIPTPPSALIGRKTAEAQLLELLSNNRMVTLTGPGGIGKTVLAQAVAGNLLATFGGDGLLVEMLSLSDPALVPSAVASVLGFNPGTDNTSFQAIARAIGARKLLLVLDNCEHLIEATATLAETLVRSCPQTTVLATSREVLRIDGEYVYRVPPLDVPGQSEEQGEDVLARSAVQLLIARTKALNADFSPDGENLRLVAAISRQLDGIPLAIEFAAARVATLGLQQVVARLDDRFGLLTRGTRTALPRHQTLLATLDWSYELLSEPEARVLRHLAVFTGDFSLDAAAAVVADDFGVASVADTVAGLVIKSLVAADLRGRDSRFRLLDTTRAYALEKLRGAREHREAARRHAEYFRNIFAQAEAQDATFPQADWLTKYAWHMGNVRAGLEWAFSADGDLQIGVALTAAAVPLWVRLSLFGECRERSEAALAKLDDGFADSMSLRMQLSAALGWSLMYGQGRTREAGPALATALKLADQLDDNDHRLRALWGLSIDQFNNGAFGKALEFAHRFAQAAQDSTDATDLMLADRLFAVSLHYLGDQKGARRYIDRVDVRLDVLADKPKVFPLDLRISTHYFRARILWLQGFADQALHLAMSTIEEGRANGHALTFCSVLGQGACPIAFLAGDFDAAERYGAALLEHAERHAIRLWGLWAACFRAMVRAKRGDFDAGLALLRSELDRAGDARFLPRFLLPLGELAACLGEANEVEQGLAAANEALERCKARQEQWYVPELLRIKGELMLRDTGHQSASSAQQCFRKALELARQQGALFWELRNAVSLARLRIGQGRAADARQILAPVYASFSKGPEIADVREARALLDGL